ncbi:hypothetical protein HanIR_Chr04g0164791 [Helianthus annuus]|nr:hypothetical protein HanIR_Chr04g0164791 [Helianthus annuus]
MVTKTTSPTWSEASSGWCNVDGVVLPSRRRNGQWWRWGDAIMQLSFLMEVGVITRVG